MILHVHYRFSINSRDDYANDSFIDDIPTFHGKPALYFDWILRLENIAVVTKCNPKQLALGKAQDGDYQMSQVFTIGHKLEQCQGHFKAAALFISTCNPCGYTDYT